MPKFTVRNMTMHYEEAGEGPLMLILHGNTSSSAMHKREIELFSQHFHVVAPDYIGVGKSDHLETWPDNWWEQNTEDVAGLIRSLDAGPAVLVGSSGGGIVSLGLTILYPELVRAVIAESCPESYPQERLWSIVEDRKNPTRELIGFWIAAHGSEWKQVVEQDTAMMARLAERGGHNFYDGRLSEIRCPVLLMGSFQDMTIPEIDKQLTSMASQIPGSELYMVNRGAHPMMWSSPVQFFTMAQSFLIRVLGSES